MYLTVSYVLEVVNTVIVVYPLPQRKLKEMGLPLTTLPSLHYLFIVRHIVHIYVLLHTGTNPLKSMFKKMTKNIFWVYVRIKSLL